MSLGAWLFPTVFLAGHLSVNLKNRGKKKKKLIHLFFFKKNIINQNAWESLTELIIMLKTILKRLALVRRINTWERNFTLLIIVLKTKGGGRTFFGNKSN